ncbi:MAG: hypothetical protein ED557_08165 [Balneola sp.]|nr:MAG: hypothetical protein ED557_08165 [Balneola sp.]
MNMKKSILTLTLLLLFVGTSKAQPNTTPVPIDFSITSTGINRFIADQWSSITSNWTGTYQGLSYNITLNRPIVDLTENTFRVILTLDINATAGGSTIYDDVTSITPELFIPAVVINPDSVIEDVRTEYNNLEAAIDNNPFIPDQRIRDVLEDILDDIDWIIFQGEVLTQTTIRWTDTFDLGFYGLPEISFAIGEGEIILTISPEIYANPPEYSFQWRRPGSTSYHIRVLSNNKFDLKSIQNTTTAGQASSLNVSVTAVFDQALNKYVATYSFTGGSASGQLLSKLKIMRQFIETVWTVQSFTTSNTDTWTNFTGITEVWGE